MVSVKSLDRRGSIWRRVVCIAPVAASVKTPVVAQLLGEKGPHSFEFVGLYGPVKELKSERPRSSFSSFRRCVLQVIRLVPCTSR